MGGEWQPTNSIFVCSSARTPHVDPQVHLSTCRVDGLTKSRKSPTPAFPLRLFRGTYNVDGEVVWLGVGPTLCDTKDGGARVDA